MPSYYDAAAQVYDASRYLTPAVADQAASFFERAAHLSEGSSFLEVGIGTGNNVLPLARRGIRVTGTDVSAAMLEQARNKPGGEVLELILDGYETLPFPEQSFSGVLTVHVLQNVGDWQALVTDISRVLRPGGVYFFAEYLLPAHRQEVERLFLSARQSLHVDDAEPVSQVTSLLPAPSRPNVRRFLESQGAAPLETTVLSFQVSEPLADLLGWYERRAFGSCWSVSEAQYPAVMRAFRARCAERYGSLDARLSSETRYDVLYAPRWR